MGEALYRAADDLYDGVTVRAYAPVGGHEELLPYLVRRLLENGANTSFVHVLLDERTPPEAVVVDPLDAVKARPGPHPRIPRPRELYGEARLNSEGVDLSLAGERERLTAAVSALDGERQEAGPIVGGRTRDGASWTQVSSPADRSRILGVTAEASDADIAAAFAAARAAQPAWNAAGGEARAGVLRAMGDELESNRDRLIALLSREAGKTLPDAIAEVRDAADFCRYYAHLAETQFAAPEALVGPAGERNSLALRGRGVSSASVPGTSPWPSSPARSPRPWPPAMRSWPSRPSRPRWSPRRR
jgi:RHH-type proline utilization regulon transcriptional repressor/proline dehydrogenase/delta 1-pyrroline-5-carboxylate dehydrogenase